MPSDYFGYMLSAEPVYSHQLVLPPPPLAFFFDWETKSRLLSFCAVFTNLNFVCGRFEYVRMDPIFANFQLWWKDGAAGIKTDMKSWAPYHKLNQLFLNKTRDDNPDCTGAPVH